MKIKTQELTGPALDWAVAKRFGHKLDLCNGVLYFTGSDIECCYSSDWSQGGPIIEREEIELTIQLPVAHSRKWVGMGYSKPRMTGPTPLIAAMRCYVASKLGDEVEIPDELL